VFFATKEMTRTTRCCLRNLSRLAFAMESCSASTSSAASSSSFLSETSRRLYQKRLATRAGRTVAGATTRRVVPSSSSIATASRVVLEHKEHKDGKEDDDVKTIAVTFTEKTGEEITVKAKVGESLMEAAHENDVELEGRIFVLLFSRCEEREREREREGVFVLAFFSFSLSSLARAFARSVRSLGASRSMKNNLEKGTWLFLFRFASLRALTILYSSLLLLHFLFFSTAR